MEINKSGGNAGRLDTSLESAGAEFLVLGNLLIEGIHQDGFSHIRFDGLKRSYEIGKEACRVVVAFV